ncbi:multidrug effflux MFS transporter [Namhaeicola litoreus]|uniref:Multidrug effflux MFS transporter n=1 Tax=Namhaeicola litoreus TaxID=1052145 RepID=A0ABW3Y492_9FLAO
MKKSNLQQFEFIALMASLMSVAALAIDALLPALDLIGISIGTIDNSQNQLIISMIFLGLGIGPLLFGPLSDSFGRKPIVYFGFLLFIFASFICLNAENLESMIFGRILQGMGLSSARTISIAMIRDTYSGDFMARIMSFVTVVFLLVPIIAPAAGKFVLDHYNWQAIFYGQLIITLFVTFWFWKRQPETLSKENRTKFTWHLFSDGTKELFKYPRTLGFTVISGFITGSFIIYLSAAQQIFHNQYHMANDFPLIFAGLSVTILLATFLNGTFVLRFGMEKLVTLSLYGFILSSLLFVLLYSGKSNPAAWVLIAFFAVQFFCIGFLFGNLRALAMQPIGHIAGIGAALTGFISTSMAIPISTYIGKNIENTALPLFLGFFISGVCSLAILYYLKWTKLKKLQI